MKVIAVLESPITIGGGFNQALNAILQMQRVCEGKFDFEVFTTYEENIKYLQQFGIKSVVFSFSFVDKLLVKLSTSSLWQTIQLRSRIIGAFEKKLEQHGCDLAYFVTATACISSLQRLNYIATVWDSCHRDMPEFPEMRDFNQLYLRDRYNRNSLFPAVVAIVDAVSSVDSIAFRYGVDHARLLPMPFTPSPFLSSNTAKSKDEVLATYKLSTGYYFYPAQFWAHKNHIRILEALLLSNKDGVKYTVVFAGGDQGNLAHLERFVEQNNLDSQVHFLGFVPTDDMRGLYEGCQAVIMPTYFGPTNLPPLEAWMLEKPLIYSSLFCEQAKDAAVLVDPDEASQLASAMSFCMDEGNCKQLIKAGQVRLRELNNELKASEEELLAILSRFEKRLRCWSKK
jgi:glycosyltransferase involved in cell wall biosynthesis